MADFRDILHSIKQREFAKVYLLMGEEPYYVDKLSEALEATVVAEEDKEFDQTILYGADANAGIVLESAGQFPLMAEFRIVILKEAQALSRAKNELDKLKNYVGKPNPQTILCICFKGDRLSSTSEILKAAKKNPKEVVVFDSPKIKEYRLGEVIKDYCFVNKIKIEEKAIELIMAKVGSSLPNIFSEIDKLQIALHGNAKTITADLVATHIGVSKEFNNFELINALSRRDYFQSLNIVKHFEVNPKANPTIVTVAMIFTFFQRLVIAAFNPDKTDKALMEALQLKTPYALREIRTALQFYNASQLVNAIHAIRDFDTRAKGIGSFQKEFPLLEELVLRIVTL